MRTATATIEELAFATVDLCQGDTERQECWTLPEREYRGTFYEKPKHPLSVVRFPDTGDDYEMAVSRVARYNARLAVKRGYRHLTISRGDWEDDLFELRSSQRVRQGREMPEAYLSFQHYPRDTIGDCPRHRDVFHGVLSPDGKLVAYCHLVQCGEVTRVNTILGHWDYLDDQVVWLLVMAGFRWHIDACGSAYGLYYTHASGHGPGLRYFKERFGMRPTRARWVFAQ